MHEGTAVSSPFNIKQQWSIVVGNPEYMRTSDSNLPNEQQRLRELQSKLKSVFLVPQIRALGDWAVLVGYWFSSPCFSLQPLSPSQYFSV